MNGLVPLSEDERGLMTHISRWGSEGYPVRKVGSKHWAWGPFRSINGAPVCFPTKKQAVESFEKYMDDGPLLSASLQLYEALKRITPLFAEAFDDLYDCDDSGEHEVVLLAREALAKAEGRAVQP
jgi:hypothetical protein